MNILLIDNGTQLLAELQTLIPGSEVTVTNKELGDIHVNEFDLVILSGSSTSSVLWNHTEFDEEIKLITTARVPLVGICFGCEILAHAFGATLRELNVPHHGAREICIASELLSKEKTLKVYEHHRWIIEKLPKEFEILAYSEDGPEAIRHRILPIYGLQFHPEKCENNTEAREIFLRIVRELTE